MEFFLKFDSVKKIVPYLLLLAAVLIFSTDVDAQCAMCKATLESNLDGDGVGSGINGGILYIMALPYLLFLTFGFFLYKHYKKTH